MVVLFLSIGKIRLQDITVLLLQITIQGQLEMVEEVIGIIIVQILNLGNTRVITKVTIEDMLDYGDL